jgi:hypothetical protein
MSTETNVFQLPQKAPYGPNTALHALMICLDSLRADPAKAHYTTRGLMAQFAWNGRMYEMELRDIGPGPSGAA